MRYEFEMIECIRIMRFLVLTVILSVICSCQNNATEADHKPKSNFSWDFSENRTFLYSFSQNVKTDKKLEQDQDIIRNIINTSGDLTIKVAANQASVSLSDSKMEIIEQWPDGSPKDTIRQEFQATIVEAMQADGSYEAKDVDLMFRLLLLLPQKILNVGDKDIVAISTPFTVNDVKLFVEGTSILSFKKYDTFLDRKCAVLKGKIDISILEIPHNFIGKYRSLNQGNATYYFDLDNGYLLGADIDMQMSSFVDHKLKDMEDYDLYLDLKSQKSIELRLKNVN